MKLDFQKQVMLESLKTTTFLLHGIDYTLKIMTTIL